MAVYFDTSRPVPLFFTEPVSLPALACIVGEHDIRLSRWTPAGCPARQTEDADVIPHRRHSGTWVGASA